MYPENLFVIKITTINQLTVITIDGKHKEMNKEERWLKLRLNFGSSSNAESVDMKCLTDTPDVHQLLLSKTHFPDDVVDSAISVISRLGQQIRTALH